MEEQITNEPPDEVPSSSSKVSMLETLGDKVEVSALFLRAHMRLKWGPTWEVVTEKTGTIQEAVEKEEPAAAEALLSTGQFDMGTGDVPAVATAVTKWPKERDVVWKACAVLACIAGDHGQAGADEVAKVTKVISRGAKHHPDDPIVQVTSWRVCPS